MINSKDSAHCIRGTFFNPNAPKQRLSTILRWLATRRIGYWPRFVNAPPGPKPLAVVSGQEVVVTFVNHATFLLQTAGKNILIDPVWSERASPVTFLGPRRHRNPGIRFDDLPQIHSILISHNHYDHLDIPTLRRLAARHSPTVFCPLGVGRLLFKAGFTDVQEMDWQQRRPCQNFTLHCMPAQHFSSRSPFDRNRTLWCGWVISTALGHIYVAGDTGFGEHFAEAAERFESFVVALLPIGAYEPEWFMGSFHMTPEQAVKAQQTLNASVAIAMHFGTFALADESMAAPVQRLKAELEKFPDQQFVVLREGESWRSAVTDHRSR
ncbi:MAG TPA: MBL fold metallo-hydrolase [Acidobacteriaceae bacterium]|nr:MBL fold metallo-hydrolase [Acidobacteriaceae bacterium]